MSVSEPDDVRPLVIFPRRQLLKGSLAATGIAAAGLAFPGGMHAFGQVPPDTQASPEATPGLATDASPVAVDSLTDAETVTLRAAIDRIIPTDELGPGAVAAGVDVFIQRTLSGYGASLLPLYQAGLAALDAAAGGDGFAMLDDEGKDELLTQIEAGTVPDVPAGFFQQLIANTRQGMFADPVYGGNKDFAGWDLLSYPGIKLLWTAEEQAIGSVVEMEHVSVAEFGGDGAQ